MAEKKKKTKGGYISVKSDKKGYLFALLPPVLSLLYVLALGIDGEYSIGQLRVFSPITKFSLFTIIVLAIGFLIWAFAGYMSAKAKITLVKSMLVCHIFPVLTIIAYFIMYLISIESEANVEDLMYILGGCGCNFFGIAGTFLYSLIAINIIEPIIDIALMISSFIIGYVVYTNRKELKNTKATKDDAKSDETITEEGKE